MEAEFWHRGPVRKRRPSHGSLPAHVSGNALFKIARRHAKRGVVALCLGGGNAIALAMERK
jgi:hypothetical protein